MPDVFLKKGRVKPLVHRHPWVFASSVERVAGDPQDGDVVDVRDPAGKVLARGFYSGKSLLRVRCFAFEPGVEPDAAWLRGRIERAVARRRDALALPSAETTAFRLVHSEGDGLPGLVVDRFGEWLAVQVSTVGLERRAAEVLDALEAAAHPRGIYRVDDADVRAKEGLLPAAGLARGQPAPEGGRATVLENGLRFEVALEGGQKTGFFCDQRENRALLASLVRGRTVLDVMSYTGGFAIHAAARGGAAAPVVAVESSAPAVAQAARNVALNGLEGRVEVAREDAFKRLGAARREGRRFGAIVLDPPAYARARADLDAAYYKYKELNALALRCLEPEGVLLTCSCSHPVDEAMFETMLREAAVEAGREVAVIARRGQAPCHPVLATCPEGRYLKAFFALVG